MFAEDIFCLLNFLQSKGLIHINSLDTLDSLLEDYDDLTGDVPEDITRLLNCLQDKGLVKINSLDRLEDSLDEFDNLTGEV